MGLCLIFGESIPESYLDTLRLSVPIPRMRVFARNLRKKLTSLGLTQAEVAKRAGISERRFSNYACEKSEPDLATLVRLANALDTTPDALLGIKKTNSTNVDQLTALAMSLTRDDQATLLACAEGIKKLRYKADR
jgi:transcriptional regulator with XRE-family HTH domain